MKNTLLLFSFLFFSWSLFAQELTQDSVNQILRKHGLENSQVMKIASIITDVHGPRLNASPQLDKATEWAVKQLKD